MAIVFKNFLKGIIGGIVLKFVRGKQQVQEKRVKGSVKQTKNSIRSANTFGMASSLAGHIRRKFLYWNKGFCDPDMVNRMNHLLMEILNYCRDPDTKRYSFEEDSFSSLTGLNFNIGSPLHKSLKTEPVYQLENGDLTITVGDERNPLQIRYPKDNSSCDIIVKVAILDLEASKVMENIPVQQITLKKTDALQSPLKFSFAVPDGCLCVAAIFVRFFGSKGGRDILFNTKTFSPGGICAAVYTPMAGKNRDKKVWRAMIPKFNMG